MRKRRTNPSTRHHKKRTRDVKKEAIQLIRNAGLDKETRESLIKEIEEICDFEDSLEEF
jgi:hypothetical protein